MAPRCEACNYADGYIKSGIINCDRCKDIAEQIGLTFFGFFITIISTQISINGVLKEMIDTWRKSFFHKETSDEPNVAIVLKLFVTYIQVVSAMTSF